MIVECISALPSNRQAERLGAQYRPGKQAFGIVPGERYVVFALKAFAGEIWIDIVDRESQPGYLFSVPLILFEVVDSHVSRFWEARVGKQGNLKIAPSSLHNDYYYD